MTVEKPKPKQLLRPISTGADSAMNQSQFVAITCNSLVAREKSFKPITKRSNRNHVVTFESHLKTALYKLRLRFDRENDIFYFTLESSYGL